MANPASTTGSEPGEVMAQAASTGKVDQKKFDDTMSQNALGLGGATLDMVKKLQAENERLRTQIGEHV